MVCETSQPLVTLKFFCPVPVLSPISSVTSSCFRRGGGGREQATPREHVRPAGAPPAGVAANRLRTLRVCLDSSLTWGTRTQNGRLLPLQTTSQLFTASSNRFIVHQEAWKSGTAAGEGGGSGASYLGRTMLVYTTRWRPRHFDPWLVLGPEGMRTVTTLSNKSPCCISKSVWKLSCCSKVFQSVWMQHF